MPSCSFTSALQKQKQPRPRPRLKWTVEEDQKLKEWVEERGMGTCDWAGFIRHNKGHIDPKRTAVRASVTAAACHGISNRLEDGKPICRDPYLCSDTHQRLDPQTCRFGEEMLMGLHRLANIIPHVDRWTRRTDGAILSRSVSSCNRAFKCWSRCKRNRYCPCFLLRYYTALLPACL